MALGNIVVYVLIGAVLGFILARLTNKPQQELPNVKDELEKTKSELDQHRKELVEHFANSAELLENIYRDYSKLCQNMAKTSTELLPEQADKENLFAKRLAHTLQTEPEKAEIEIPEAPRDYSETSSGLLKGESALPKTEEKEEAEVKAVVKEEKKETTEKVE